MTYFWLTFDQMTYYFVALAQKWLFYIFVQVPPYCGSWICHATFLLLNLYFSWSSITIILYILTNFRDCWGWFFVGLPDHRLVSTEALILHFLITHRALPGIFKYLDGVGWVFFSCRLFLTALWFLHGSIANKVNAALSEMSRGCNKNYKTGWL